MAAPATRKPARGTSGLFLWPVNLAASAMGAAFSLGPFRGLCGAPTIESPGVCFVFLVHGMIHLAVTVG